MNAQTICTVDVEIVKNLIANNQALELKVKELNDKNALILSSYQESLGYGHSLIPVIEKLESEVFAFCVFAENLMGDENASSKLKLDAVKFLTDRYDFIDGNFKKVFNMGRDAQRISDWQCLANYESDEIFITTAQELIIKNI